MIYVIIQFSVLFYMAFNVNWMHLQVVAIIIFGCSIFLGIWSILSMGIRNISILPDPKENITMRTIGPYKIIRHPMYSAVLIFSIGMLISNPEKQMYIAILVLIIDLFFKLKYEEKILQLKFKDYKDYKKKTFRMIPFIY